MNQELLLMGQAMEAIRRADRILVLADQSPDGDSIGSSAAMVQWLMREGKQVDAYCSEIIPSTLHHIDHVHRFTRDPKIFEKQHDLLLSFDAGDLGRAGLLKHQDKLSPTHTLIVFDHHATNQRFGHINIVFTEACSTAEVLYRFFDAHHVALDPEIGTALLTGILFDTSFFSNSGTTIKGIEAAGKCVSAGARHGDILRHLLKNKSIPGLKIWGLGLSRLTHIRSLDLAYTYFLQDDLRDVQKSDEAVAGVSNFLNAICRDVDTVLVLREAPENEIRGSFRTISRDVAKLAQYFGGGGHKKAAGFSIKGRIKVDGNRVRIV